MTKSRLYLVSSAVAVIAVAAAVAVVLQDPGTDATTSAAATPAAKPPATGAPGATPAPIAQAAKAGPASSIGTDPAPTPASVAADAMPKPAAAPATAPSVDVMTVDKDGSAVIAGRSAPAAKVTVFEDSRPIGTVQANRSGEWVLVPEKPLTPGMHDYKLTAEAKDAPAVPSEKHLALAVPERPAVPPLPVITTAAPQPAAPVAQVRDWVVRRGDNLWSIARQMYGDGLKYWDIVRANEGQIRDPDLIYPDQKFTVPQGAERQ